ncbi:hypothetical protein L3V83_13615 [Thiotrichales bacterium 19X7-9]|nr:hypothetical protein [Thiotrichales bacterium 19X7-9]
MKTEIEQNIDSLEDLKNKYVKPALEAPALGSNDRQKAINEFQEQFEKFCEKFSEQTLSPQDKEIFTNYYDDSIDFISESLNVNAEITSINQSMRAREPKLTFFQQAQEKISDIQSIFSPQK